MRSPLILPITKEIQAAIAQKEIGPEDAKQVRAYADVADIDRDQQMTVTEWNRFRSKLSTPPTVGNFFEKRLTGDTILDLREEQKSNNIDRARYLSLHTNEEKAKLKKLSEELKDMGALSPQEIREKLDGVQTLALKYLRLGSSSFEDPKEAAAFRKALNGLAATVFEQLAKLADQSSYDEIRKLAPLYDAYHFLAEGDVESATNNLEMLCVEGDAPPEAQKLLATIRSDQLQHNSLVALEIWQGYSDELSEQADRHANETIDGQFVQAWTLAIGGESGLDRRAKELQGERTLIEELRKQILSKEAANLREALELVAGSNRPELRSKALEYLSANGSLEKCRTLGEIRPLLIEYASQNLPDTNLEERLFRQTLNSAQDNRTLKSAHAVYMWLESKTTNTKLRDQVKAQRERIQEVGEEYASTNIGDAFHGVTEMAFAGAVAAPVHLATLLRLQKMGVTGYRGVAVAMGAEAIAEGVALGTIEVGKSAFSIHAAKALSPDVIAKTYGANLLMMGLLKPFARAGQFAGPRAARSMGLVAKGRAGLSTGGKALSWALGHGGGFAGMIAANRGNQAVGFSEAPSGSLSQSLADDFIGYVRFAVAHKALDRFSGGRLSGLSYETKAKAAGVEALLRAEAQVTRLGYSVSRRGSEGQASGQPKFSDPRGDLLYRQFSQIAMTRQGFDGDKAARLIARGRQAELRYYLKGFGLKPVYQGRNFAGFDWLLPQEPSGIDSAGPDTGNFKKGLRRILSAPALLFLGAGVEGPGGGSRAGQGASEPNMAEVPPFKPDDSRLRELQKKNPEMVEKFMRWIKAAEDGDLSIQRNLIKTLTSREDRGESELQLETIVASLLAGTSRNLDILEEYAKTSAYNSIRDHALRLIKARVTGAAKLVFQDGRFFHHPISKWWSDLLEIKTYPEVAAGLRHIPILSLVWESHSRTLPTHEEAIRLLAQLAELGNPEAHKLRVAESEFGTYMFHVVPQGIQIFGPYPPEGVFLNITVEVQGISHTFFLGSSGQGALRNIDLGFVPWNLPADEPIRYNIRVENENGPLIEASVPLSKTQSPFAPPTFQLEPMLATAGPFRTKPGIFQPLLMDSKNRIPEVPAAFVFPKELEAEYQEVKRQFRNMDLSKSDFEKESAALKKAEHWQDHLPFDLEDARLQACGVIMKEGLEILDHLIDSHGLRLEKLNKEDHRGIEHRIYRFKRRMELETWEEIKALREASVEAIVEKAEHDMVTARTLFALVVARDPKAIEAYQKYSEKTQVDTFARVCAQLLNQEYGQGPRKPQTFSWEANHGRARRALELLAAGETDIDKLAAAVHQGWSEVAKTYEDPIYREKPEEQARRLKLAYTPYAALSEASKNQCRDIARNFLAQYLLTDFILKPSVIGVPTVGPLKFYGHSLGFPSHSAQVLLPTDTLLEVYGFSKDEIEAYRRRHSGQVDQTRQWEEDIRTGHKTIGEFLSYFQLSESNVDISLPPEELAKEIWKEPVIEIEKVLAATPADPRNNPLPFSKAVETSYHRARRDSFAHRELSDRELEKYMTNTDQSEPDPRNIPYRLEKARREALVDAQNMTKSAIQDEARECRDLLARSQAICELTENGEYEYFEQEIMFEVRIRWEIFESLSRSSSNERP